MRFYIHDNEGPIGGHLFNLEKIGGATNIKAREMKPRMNGGVQLARRLAVAFDMDGVESLQDFKRRYDFTDLLSFFSAEAFESQTTGPEIPFEEIERVLGVAIRPACAHCGPPEHEERQGTHHLSPSTLSL